MNPLLMVIAPDQFRDEEYALPKEVLEARGATVVTGSVAPGPCRGKLGMLARAEVAIRDVDPEEFVGVVFVGGSGSAVFFDDADAHRVARSIAVDGKVTAAICIAPSTLARAGLLEGRQATAFPSQERDLRAHGVEYTGAPVEVDGVFVTASGPDAAREFGNAVADALGL